MKGLKYACLLVAVLTAMIMTAVTARSAMIESISHALAGDDKERVTFVLNESIIPKIFTIKGDNPRLVLDFPGTTYKGKGNITPAEGRLAGTIRVGMHQEPEQKVRVVIDLAKGMTVQHALVPGDNANLLIIELAGQAGTGAKQEAPVKAEAPVKSETPVAAIVSQPVPASSPQPTAVVAPVEEKPLPVPAPAQVEKPASTLPPAVPADKVSGLPRLLNISFDDSSAKGEMVLFHLNGFHPPTVSAMEKDNPRVFCDFPGMELDKGVEAAIAAKGKYVESISTGKQGKPEKIRVTLHLVPNRDYDLQQVFFKTDNLFVLIVNELPSGKSQ